MDETGDQCMSSVMTRLNSLELNENSMNENKILIEIIDEMKDKCERIVNNKEDNQSMDQFSEDHHLREVDSDAEIDETIDYRNDGHIYQINDRLEDKSNENEIIKVKIVSTEPIDPTVHQISEQRTGLDSKEGPVVSSTHFNQLKDLKVRTEKWGESGGIFDSNGCVKRVVDLSEVHNYLQLKTSMKIDSEIYCSLINERFPRFFDSTIDCK